MKTLITVTCIISFMFCAGVWAQEATSPTSVTCQKGDLSRTIEVIYTGEQGEPPCEVHYKKVVEEAGHDQILWSAEREKGYCETKQQEFKAKLESWGWTCQ